MKFRSPREVPLPRVLALVVLLPALAAAAAEIELTPPMQRELTAVIQRLGYTCPLAKIAEVAEVAGGEASGDEVKVFCGPRNHAGVYPNVVFRLTYHPDGRITVVPWRD